MIKSQEGVALLIVLWILAVLMVMALSFSVMTRAHSYDLLFFKEGMINKYLAEAGVNRGVTEIIYRSVNRTQSVTLVGKDIWRTDGTSYSINAGDGGYRLRILDETGKISLNWMTDNSGIILKNLLVRQGVTSEEADIIVDSILDWKDRDNLHRLSGAEDEHYMSLPNPYKARNGYFETLDELILVRGMTPQILYGDSKSRGIIHLLSLVNNSTQINMNAAPAEVLAALPGVSEEMVKRLMETRTIAEFRGAEDVADIIGDSYPVLSPYVTFTSPGEKAAFTIESSGYQKDRKANYSIMATVAFDGPSRYHYVYYKSPVELKQ